MEGALPRRLEGGVVAAGPVEPPGGHRDAAGEPCEDGLDQGGEVRPCGGERHGGLGGAPAAPTEAQLKAQVAGLKAQEDQLAASFKRQEAQVQQIFENQRQLLEQH